MYSEQMNKFKFYFASRCSSDAAFLNLQNVPHSLQQHCPWRKLTFMKTYIFVIRDEDNRVLQPNLVNIRKFNALCADLWNKRFDSLLTCDIHQISVTCDASNNMPEWHKQGNATRMCFFVGIQLSSSRKHLQTNENWRNLTVSRSVLEITGTKYRSVPRFSIRCRKALWK